VSLNESPTWSIQDSTKLQKYLHCPREYLFEYVLGWRPENPSIHLEFGQAWHLAMEELLLRGYSSDAQELAYIRLLQHHRKFFAEVTDDIYYPKTPGFAREMLKKYCAKYSRDFYDFKVHYTEISGRVSIDENRAIAFKTDDIIEFTSGPHAGKYSSLEHKTTKTMKGAWADQWANKVQIYTYYHVLRCIYGDKAYGIIVNGAQFQKADPNFMRLHVIPSFSQMAQWHWEVLRLFENIEKDMETLLTWDPGENFLPAFPRNGEACIDYNHTCQFMGICSTWLNPLRFADNPPQGFAVNHWNPLERETTHRMDIAV